MDLASLNPEQSAELLGKYVGFLKQNIPSASQEKITDVGPRKAIVVELPSVEMPNRPLRSGMHYLVFDGLTTVSVDCLWTSDHAAKAEAACKAVASNLKAKDLKEL